MSSYYSVFKDKQGNTLIPYQIKELKKQVSEIIESGQNYIKLSDGTMICYGKAQIENPTYSDWYGFCRLTNTMTKNFPKEFINNDISLQLTSRSFGYTSAIITSVEKGKFDFRGFTHNQANYNPGTGNFDYIAIGRWK